MQAGRVDGLPKGACIARAQLAARAATVGAWALTVLLSAGCMTQQAYQGGKLPRDAVARISGDLRFTAGAPLSVLLRQVDDRVLGVSESSVDVLPGEHHLLVDCRIQETNTTTRHSLQVDVLAGQRYRLVADSGPARTGCSGVRLEPAD